MRTRGVAQLFVHTVTVETYQGAGAYGDIFAAPVTLAPPNGCLVENARRVVRNKDGIEVVSNTHVYTSAANGALFTTDSRVTTSDGVVARVNKGSVNDAPGLNLPDHTAVDLI